MNLSEAVYFMVSLGTVRETLVLFNQFNYFDSKFNYNTLLFYCPIY